METSKHVLAFTSARHRRGFSNRKEENTQLISLQQWFLTGGTRTPWGYQTPKQGVRCTYIFRHTHPENFKDVLSIVVSAVNFVRGQT